jgi:hypothetical protein
MMTTPACAMRPDLTETGLSLDDVAELANELRVRLPDEPFWCTRLAPLASRDCAAPRAHLAVIHEPFLDHLLAGRKTVESRFSVNRLAPFGEVDAGDLLLLKEAAGPVVGVALIDHVGFYELDPQAWKDIRVRFARALCAEDDEFWAARARARYATLMHVQAVRRVAPLSVDKRDRRGWVVLRPSAGEQMRLLP